MKKEEKDRAILLASENEFATKGLQAAAMETIAKEAGVSKATLYKYYPNKELLFEHLLERLLKEIKDRYFVHYQPSAPLPQLLEQAIEKKVGLMKDRNFMSLCKMLMIEMMKSKANYPIFEAQLQESHLWFNELMQQCQRDGKVTQDVDADELSNCFHALVENALFWPLILGLREEITDAEIAVCKSQILRVFASSYAP